jgi:hypothetical protein
VRGLRVFTQVEENGEENSEKKSEHNFTNPALPI